MSEVTSMNMQGFHCGWGKGYKGKLRFGGFPPVSKCGSVWGRVVGQMNGN